MLEFKCHAIANAADDVSVCENVVVVLVGIEDDSTASGIARENATRRTQHAIGVRIGRACIGDCSSSSSENDNENSGELTLQIRDRRDQDLSAEEVRTAHEDFAGLWEELDFDERQYAIRLLLKQITLRFEKKQKEGQIRIEAWGRRPTPLRVSLEKARNGKLRNQDGRLPRQDSNLRQGG
jgi:hypothetical protein